MATIRKVQEAERKEKAQQQEVEVRANNMMHVELIQNLLSIWWAMDYPLYCISLFWSGVVTSGVPPSK